MNDDWLKETHSQRFELCRHFFLRFFDSDQVSQPGQWQTVAIGVFSVLFSFGILYLPGLYRKYLTLGNLHTPGPYRAAMFADLLCAITLAMTLIAILTTIQWQSLFPALRDYLALASLPLRIGDIFLAKFAALVLFMLVFILACTLLPSVLLPNLFAGAYGGDTWSECLGLFVSSSLGAVFVFFSLVSIQGLLLIVLPVRRFGAVSLSLQGALLIVLLCGLPLVFSISGLKSSDQAFAYWAWAPPVWFLGIDRVLAGDANAAAIQVARLGFDGIATTGVLAVSTYWVGCLRHRVRVLETQDRQSDERSHPAPCVVERWVGDPRQFAVLAFIGKTLARSRQHRLILIAFVAVGFALISDSLVGFAPGHGGSGFAAMTAAKRQAVVSVPLALTLFVLAGLRYLFRLPVELPANWLFRVHEPGNSMTLLAAVERFLVWCGAVPVMLLTLSFEIRLLGAGVGIATSILCFSSSLLLIEFLLLRWQAIPFTSSYLPGQMPVIQVLIIYGAAVVVYVSALSKFILYCSRAPLATFAFVSVLLLVRLYLRANRLQRMKTERLGFEELPLQAVAALQVEPD